MKYFCNPINVNYRYQFNADPRKHGELQICREAADPSLILFKGRYYIFASMTLGVWVSDDLVNWENHRLPVELPLYDYAPDVRVLGDWVYFCASNISSTSPRTGGTRAASTAKTRRVWSPLTGSCARTPFISTRPRGTRTSLLSISAASAM